MIHAGGERLVHETARFVDHAKTAVIEAALDVFARLANVSEFEIMDGTRAIEGDGRDDAVLDEVDEDRVEAALDGVGAHHHHDGPLVADRRDRRANDGAEIVPNEDVRQ